MKPKTALLAALLCAGCGISEKEALPQLTPEQKALDDSFNPHSLSSKEPDMNQNPDDRYTAGGKRVHAKHPEWNYLACNAIAKKQIAVGMSAEQVRAAWGNPYRINKTTTEYGQTQQWVMRKNLPTAYVYFDEDGTCVAIQN